jgi:hypothetical protein
MSNEQRETVISRDIISGKRHSNGLLKAREMPMWEELIGKRVDDVTESKSGLIKIIFEGGRVLDFHKEENGQILICFDGDWDFWANV